jgi:D-methionine transport system permease protein
MSDLELALKLIPLQLWNTLYMVFASGFFATLIGVPLGIYLTLLSKGHLKEHKILYKLLSLFVNTGRSLPFAILMVALIPLTRVIAGTSLGTTAAIVPLTIAAIPFLARIVESSLKDLDPNLIETAKIMGSTNTQIVTKVLIPEALPSLYSGITLMLINLIGYSTMAGLIGGGGLGQLAIQYGYNRFNSTIMIGTTILLIILVQLVQWAGNTLTQSLLKKRGLA